MSNVRNDLHGVLYNDARDASAYRDIHVGARFSVLKVVDDPIWNVVYFAVDIPVFNSVYDLIRGLSSNK